MYYAKPNKWLFSFFSAYVSNGSRLKICLNKKGKETIGKDIYDNGPAIYDKINEMYRTIYQKNNQN
ncbi:hypothetical protein [Capnocytophaga canimorsus]|uniref:hypothetical protein n=1 Tax=Capnocytophaga canimorsus TaxID=28188 RepID=UPI001EDD4923|nr:hypothetical protein [Capnocytophaga canimorsus]